MKIAIHQRSASFSESWIDYCIKENINYKLVNAFDNDIIEQVKGCDVFMWHHHHDIFKDTITAKKILFALEHAGIRVFPNYNTGWHFDDKVAQKYLLEAIGAPFVPSYVFYSKKEALEWSRNISYPKVWKLKGGAGASNVKLLRTQTEAKKYINKAFGKGFSQFDRWGNLREHIRNYKAGKSNLLRVIKGFGRLFIPTEYARLQAREKGYIYFQDFIPDNKYDVRVVVIGGKKAVAEKRFVRENDFRASGSGAYSYDGIGKEVISIAFNIAKQLRMQSVAFDFIFDENNNPLIVEISYGFGTVGLTQAPGYWNEDLSWQEAKVCPQNWILTDFISHLNK